MRVLEDSCASTIQAHLALRALECFIVAGLSTTASFAKHDGFQRDFQLPTRVSHGVP